MFKGNKKIPKHFEPTDLSLLLWARKLKENAEEN